MIDLKDCYADNRLIVRRKESPPEIPEVSLGQFLFEKLDVWPDKLLFVSCRLNM